MVFQVCAEIGICHLVEFAFVIQEDTISCHAAVDVLIKVFELFHDTFETKIDFL
jgi:hypothetical protein